MRRAALLARLALWAIVLVAGSLYLGAIIEKGSPEDADPRRPAPGDQTASGALGVSSGAAVTSNAPPAEGVPQASGARVDGERVPNAPPAEPHVGRDAATRLPTDDSRRAAPLTADASHSPAGPPVPLASRSSWTSSRLPLPLTSLIGNSRAPVARLL
jgi:hypothetical protein